MRILHIIRTISPEAGGPTEAIRMLIEHAPPGYTSEVVTLDDPAEPFLATFPFKITALGSPKQSWYAPAITRWLRANRDRFDGVMIHGLWEYTGVAVLRAIAGHKPYVVFPHGMLDPYFKRRFPAKHAKKWIYWLLNEYWLLRSAYRVLFITQIEADLARQSFWPSQWTPMVMALGTEPPPHDPIVSIPAFYDLCQEVRGKPFLLFLGRIHPKKGPDLLLDAFTSAIAQANPDLHLVMAGPDSGNWSDELHKRVEASGFGERVHWTGMLRGEPKWGAFAASEAFILTSHQENFGIAVAEALACGKPVLISDQVNIAAEIAADGAGLVEPDTLEGSRRLLQRWLALSAEERAAMSTQALRTFAARYDMRHNSEAILRVFEPSPDPAPRSLVEVH